jgi:hypothetical protein
MANIGAAEGALLTRDRMGNWLRKYAIIMILLGMIALLTVATGGTFLRCR